MCPTHYQSKLSLLRLASRHGINSATDQKIQLFLPPQMSSCPSLIFDFLFSTYQSFAGTIPFSCDGFWYRDTQRGSTQWNLRRRWIFWVLWHSWLWFSVRENAHTRRNNTYRQCLTCCCDNSRKVNSAILIKQLEYSGIIQCEKVTEGSSGLNHSPY